MYTKPIEKDTEYLINNQLQNLKWILDTKNPKRNVFFQHPKTKKQQKLLEGKSPDYVLYPTSSDDPLIIIEAKRAGESINKALEQGIHYAKKLNAPIVYATDGVFIKTIHIKENKPLILNGEEIDEFIREIIAIQYIGTNEINTLDKKVIKSRSELISIFSTANNLLRSEGISAGIERFSEFSNILFLKLISEIEEINEELDQPINIPKHFRWNYFKDKKGEELLYYVNKIVLNEFQNKYEDNTIFQSLEIRNPKTLEKIINNLNDLQLTDINADIKGDAFEYFLRSYNAGNKDLGEYFTPRHIVKTMVKLLNPQYGEKIYDPFCGTGGMLIESFRHIYKSMPKNINTEDILRHETVYGRDITKTSRIAKMNMILMGDGHNNIERIDSLANPIENKFDVVITNMPFSQTTEFYNLYDIPTEGSKNGDSICIQHCLRSSIKGGRLAIIVPEGFLFDKKYKKVREYILAISNIRSLISLPSGVFLPYNGIKTNILLIDNIDVLLYSKERSKHFLRHNGKNNIKNKFYWYFEVKNDGFTLNNQRDKIEGGNDLEVIVSERDDLYKNDKQILKLGINKINITDVCNNDFILVGSKYLFNTIYKSKYPMMKLGELVDLLRGPFGSSIKKSVCVNKGYKLYEQQNVINNDFKIGKYFLDENKFNELKKFEIKKDDILITCAGTLGKVSIVPEIFEQGIINSVLMRLRIKKDIIPEYLKLVLESDVLQSEMVEQSMGTGIKNMRPGKQLKNILIPVPSIKIQESIVNEIKSINKLQKEYEERINRLNNNKNDKINSIWLKNS
jgi:type I restriction enzyme M protein